MFSSSTRLLPLRRAARWRRTPPRRPSSCVSAAGYGAAGAAAVSVAVVAMAVSAIARGDVDEVDRARCAASRTWERGEGKGGGGGVRGGGGGGGGGAVVGDKILFLGSGSSTGCPRPLCSILFPPHMDGGGGGEGGDDDDDEEELRALRERMVGSCRTSVAASRGNPHHNRDYRNNPSIVISHTHRDDEEDEDDVEGGGDEGRRKGGGGGGRRRNVVIDAGKTFREAALRWMPSGGIASVDAVVLTHEHMDSIGGLDDLRGFQVVLPRRRQSLPVGGEHGITHGPHGPPERVPLPVYLSEECYRQVRGQFHYLVPRGDGADDDFGGDHDSAEPESESESVSQTRGASKPVVKRSVAALRYRRISPFEPFVAAGLRMVPIPVMHGEDLVCLGFAFTVNDTNVLYLSDVSRVPPETERYILGELPPTDVLVIDSLHRTIHNPTHVSLVEAVGIADRLMKGGRGDGGGGGHGGRVYVVGINCDDFPTHYDANAMLRERYGGGGGGGDAEGGGGEGGRGFTVQLAHDGLVLDL